jgi:predicted AAA+ superfamily ATPase
MISRHQLSQAKNYLFKGKALIIYGPRQTGKTTFCEMLLKEIDLPTLKLNGDEFDVREMLKEPNTSSLKRLIGNNKVVLIDEAQRIEGIGLCIKIIIDQLKEVQVIATGSSSFELAGDASEPLTGRKYEITLLPLCYQELVDHFGFLKEKRELESRLIFGNYPEIVSKPTEAEEHLKLIAESYLYKDLLKLEQIKKPELLQKLVKALALQVGSEANVNELSNLLQASNQTIEKYIQLLEDAFVVFSLTSYSKNVRNELRKSRKIYFVDNGIMNAAKGDLNLWHKRQDKGALWENYLISERRKKLNIEKSSGKQHFWRTTQRQEIDYLETEKKQLKAFEIKWNPKKKAKFSKTFTGNYPEAAVGLLNPENYFDFLEID